MKLFVVALALISQTVFAAEPPGCRTAKEFLPLARLYSELQSDSDGQQAYRQMKKLKRLTCQGEFSLNETLTYASGSVATLYAGKNGATWNWPNGNTITLYAHRNNVTWFWPNGQIVTLRAYQTDASWFWPNGQLITTRAGVKGASYFGPDGSILLKSGPELKGSHGELDVPAFLDLIDDLSADISPAP